MTGSNPVDRSKLSTKMHILTNKNGIPISAVISSASTHDIKLVTMDVIDNAVIKRTFVSGKPKRMRQRKYHHLLCLKAYQSKSIEQEIIKRGYVPHIPYKRKKGQVRKDTNQKRYFPSKNKRWVVERTNSWIIGSESCLQCMKRKQITILVWCSYHIVSSSVEK
jgi:hypothetical protein